MKIHNSKGLSFQFLENGAVKSIHAGSVRISLKEASCFSGNGTNFFFRKRTNPMQFTPLLGPGSNSCFFVKENCYIAEGFWEELEYRCLLRLACESLSWEWNIEFKNTGNVNADLDLIYFQDIVMKAEVSGPVNEYYLSQYLERRILVDTDYGKVICCRQNMKEDSGHPWLMLAFSTGAIAGSTDGMQFYGKTFRATGIPEGLSESTLGGEYAGESSVVALQASPFILKPGESKQTCLAGFFLSDHPLATSIADLKRLPTLFKQFDTSGLTFENSGFISPPVNLFNTSSLLPVEDLSDNDLSHYFGNNWRHLEKKGDELLSFFHGDAEHVVLRSKELLSARPHAHIMQSNTGLVPQENIVSTTVFAFGVFNSHITQGNTNFNSLLSVCTSQFNQSPHTGQRIFVEINGKLFLLGVPSAFEMGLNHCRWIYKFGSYCLQVRTWTSMNSPLVNLDFQVLNGQHLNLVITHDFDSLNTWKVFADNESDGFIALPDKDSMIAAHFPDARYRIKINSVSDVEAGGNELLYSDGQNHGESLFVIKVNDTTRFFMSFIAEVTGRSEVTEISDPDLEWVDCRHDALAFWKNMSMNIELQSDQHDISAIREVLPWFGMNALVHYLTPYGLEQFGGAAWGTRDVTQGPVELLLTLGRFKEARRVLCIIFSNQHPDGGWPQWWMFDSYHKVRAHEAHGDIFYWVIIALSKYIMVSGDSEILNEELPYYGKDEKKSTERSPLHEHMERLIQMIIDSFIPNTSLVPFGGGDWNDSLQPVSKMLAERLISSWTVEMNYQAFRAYKEVCERVGFIDRAIKLRVICENIKTDFNNHLIKEGVVAGYGLLEADGSINVLLHPSDQTTGIHYSILPMNRGIISELFNSKQAKDHQQVIELHLKGPDGARLMDRPLKYNGGIQKIFQRAESSTYFGREIGLMYMHEHLRYAETLAITGKADEFVKALRQAIPVGYNEIVTCGDIRQANCYYSSSDVIFKNRYEADENYQDVINGSKILRSGWRVYSSGPGIYIGLIITRLLGIRIESESVILDPVMPFAFSGLTVSMNFLGRQVSWRYQIKVDNHSPKSVFINQRPVEFANEPNLYRNGGAKISKDMITSMMDQTSNVIQITI